MPPERGPFRRRFLDDGQRGEGVLPVSVLDIELGPERVDAGGLQPLPGPGVEIPARALLERPEEVGQLRVSELVPLAVEPQPLQQLLLAHPRHELAQHRGSLGVRDAVEVQVDRLHVGDVGHDGMRGGELVLAIGPRLLGVGEGGPRLRPPRGLALGVHRHEAGEALVQPQVAPPPHGHQIAEPHMGQLVQESVGAALPGRVGDPRAEDVQVVEGDAGGVLHGPGVGLRDEHLVVLGPEGVGVAEGRLEEVEALLGDLEQLVGVQGLGQ